MTASNKVLAGPGTKEFIQPDQWLSSPVVRMDYMFILRRRYQAYLSKRPETIYLLLGWQGASFTYEGCERYVTRLRTGQTACMHAWAIKSCHRDLWTAPREARVHHTLKGGPGWGSALCNAVVVEFKSGKFGWDDVARQQGLPRLVHLCGASTRLRHLSKINKLYLICSVMQCPVSTHKI